MAVDTKQGTTNGAAPNGAAANGAAAAAKRRRSSSLMNSASSLPNVEHSLEEFIAKANQTLVDVSTWGNADQQAKADEDKRKEQDAQRWKQAETQMRESEAREQSLRRQLDGLQGKLAEAEARAAVAMSSSGASGGGGQLGSAAHDATLSELKKEIEESLQRVRAAEEKSQRLSQELISAKAEATARASGPIESTLDDGEAAERIRLAEAKAAKALAAARAAQAGLTVSSADLAAIESGLVVVEPPAKKSALVPILISFVAGTAIMFGVWKFVLVDEQAPGPAAGAAVQQPVQATPPAAPPTAPAEPVVTPIVEPAPAPGESDGPTVTPIVEPTATGEAAAAEPAVEPEAAAVQPKAAVEDARPAKAKRPRTRPKAKAKAKPGLADPFATKAKTKKKAKPAPDKKPAGGIVDPF